MLNDDTRAQPAPNFNPEIGFLRRRNFRKNYLQLRFSPRPQRIRGVRKFSYVGTVDYITDFDRHLESRQVTGSFTTDLNNSDQFVASVQSNFESLPVPFPIAPGVTIPPGPYPFTTTLLYGRPAPSARTVTVNTARSTHPSRRAANGRLCFNARRTEPTFRATGLTCRVHSERIRNASRAARSPRAGVSALVQYVCARALSDVRFQWDTAGSDLFIVYGDGRTSSARRCHSH